MTKTSNNYASEGLDFDELMKRLLQVPKENIKKPKPKKKKKKAKKSD